MRTTFVYLAALATLAFATQAQAFTMDLGGVEVDGAAINVISFDNTDPDSVSSITFDFTYVSVAPSWSEEMAIQIEHVPSGSSLTLGSRDDYCTSLFAAACDINFGGIQNSDPLEVNLLTVNFAVGDASGLWTFSFGDGLDDAGDPTGLDGQFEDGSEIFVNQSAVIPVPAAVWLFGSALLGFAGLRRRS